MLRRALLQIHLWLGLTIGLLWAISGLTGALLVFGKEADRLAGMRGTQEVRASLDEVLANATTAADGEFIERLLIRDRHGEIINALYADSEGRKRIVVIDAATAEPVKLTEWEPRRPFGGSLYRWLYTAHMTYLAGANGMTFVGFSGLFLISAAITGLWVGWPRRGSWKATFAASKWRKLDHHLYGWHRAIGLTVGLIFVCSATTGALMAFPEEPVRQFLARHAGFQPTHVVKSAGHHGWGGDERAYTGSHEIGMQRAVEVAQDTFPGAPWVRIWPPTMHYPYYTVRVRQPGEIRDWLGTTTVVVDAKTGAATGVYDAVKAPLSNKLFDAIYSLHNGEIIRLPGRVLAVLVGLALPILYVTGIWRWLRQRRKAKLVRSTQRSPVSC